VGAADNVRAKNGPHEPLERDFGQLPEDLNFIITIDTVNTGTIIYSIVFSLFCSYVIPLDWKDAVTKSNSSGAVISKIVNPSRCQSITIHPRRYTGIPTLMSPWGLVTMSHGLIKNKGRYLAVSTSVH
jgi:hypothetical protein